MDCYMCSFIIILFWGLKKVSNFDGIACRVEKKRNWKFGMNESQC